MSVKRVLFWIGVMLSVAVSIAIGQTNPPASVKIGKNTWTKQNINIETPNSWCYENKSANCAKYGRLYTWDAAMSVCPSGWRLPDTVEWSDLIVAVGGKKVYYNKLKRHFYDVGTTLNSTSGWSKGKNGDDKFGFSAMPSGTRQSTGDFKHGGAGAMWWSATGYRDSDAFWITTNGNMAATALSHKSDGGSVRCVQEQGGGQAVALPPQAAAQATEATSGNDVHGSFTDARDGQKYRTAIIGKQAWMAENLNFKAQGSICYGNNEANCAKYGRLYGPWPSEDACPSGWRLPSDDDWNALVKVVGGTDVTGKKLKSTSGWNKNGNGTDELGFSALPGGCSYSGSENDGFYRIGDAGFWWSSTLVVGELPIYWYVENDNGKLGSDNHNSFEGESGMHSIRCIQK